MKRSYPKFIIGSAIGVLLFLIPIPYDGSFTVIIGLLSDWVKDLLGDAMLYLILVITLLGAVMSTVGSLFKPSFITENPKLQALFVTSPLYLISRILGALITALVVFDLGPDFITSGDTGGTMIGISKSLIAIIVSISYLMPLLTDFGVMEFTGVIIKKIVRPLFTLPGRSAIDLVTSWLGAANAAVLLTKRQYDLGFYSAREAAVIMTNFSLVSVPFCLITAAAMGMQNMFLPMYLTTTFVGILLAVIIPRIPPLRTIPDTYSETAGKNINEEVPEDQSLFRWAGQLAAEKAAQVKLADVLKTGTDMLTGVVFNMTPVVIAWGTIALILVEYTPIFQWISYPMGLYLNLFQVELAFEAAPATLVGFADMFIPALLLANIPSLSTKFIVGTLSLVQIIYLTEVGIIAIQSDVPLNIGNLFIIFLERTLIAIPLIVLISKLIL